MNSKDLNFGNRRSDKIRVLVYMGCRQGKRRDDKRKVNMYVFALYLEALIYCFSAHPQRRIAIARRSLGQCRLGA